MWRYISGIDDTSTKPIRIKKGYVVGQYCNSRPGRIKHIAFAYWNGLPNERTDALALPIVHMSDRLGNDEFKEDGVVAWKENLSDDHLEELRDIIQNALTLCSPYYQADPAYATMIDASNQKRIVVGCSCVGFVLFCFSELGMNLISLDRDNLRDISLNDLLQMYPYLSEKRQREISGLFGAGPWRLVMPSFVFFALENAESSIRAKDLPLEFPQE